jgi:hypothetical protein
MVSTSNLWTDIVFVVFRFERLHPVTMQLRAFSAMA